MEYCSVAILVLFVFIYGKCVLILTELNHMPNTHFLVCVLHRSGDGASNRQQQKVPGALDFKKEFGQEFGGGAAASAGAGAGASGNSNKQVRAVWVVIFFVELICCAWWCITTLPKCDQNSVLHKEKPCVINSVITGV